MCTTKKYIISLTSFLLFALSLFAQYSDNEAKNILDKTAQTIQKNGAIKTEFVLLIENNQTGEKQNMSGMLWLKGNKFKLNIADTETFFDGETQWVYMKDADEVSVSTPTEEELQEVNPTTIISSYKQGYKLKRESDKTINGKTVYEVSVYPEEHEKPFHTVKMSIEKTTYNIVSIATYGKNGVNSFITVKKFDKMIELSDAVFVFDKKLHPTAEIIDLR